VKMKNVGKKLAQIPGSVRFNNFMQITGKTRTYAVLGQPIRHTLSPPMHNAALHALGMDAVYLPYEVAPDQLMEVLQAMQAMGFGGVNLTIPHKQVAFAGIAELDASAQLVGAVNTVCFTDQGLKGYSTDGYGILKAIEEAFGLSVQGQAITVIGCGGAGRSIALVCARAGASSITLWNRSPERAEQVASEILDCPVHIVTDLEADATAIHATDLLIQATSVGMKPGDPSPLPASCFRAGQKLIDTIYVSEETPIMQLARASGVEAVNGLGMLLHQGVKSFEIWTGVLPPVEVMREALRETVYGKGRS
jgi:shikimate dehydrogenase